MYRRRLHIEMYPRHHRISEQAYTELSGMLTFASLGKLCPLTREVNPYIIVPDVNTSMTSIVAYRADDVHRMLALVKSAKGK